MPQISAQLLQSALVRARAPINAVLRTPIVAAMCTPRHVDEYLSLFDRAWSVRDVRARVVAVQAEPGGATSLWLRPNEHWSGFRAGQYVRITVAIAGRLHARCFSISSAPEDGLPLRITIRALPGGRIATWAAQSARRGDVIALSRALGEFVLPERLPERLLFVSGGSGITPIASLVRHLLATGYAGEIACLHYARDEAILGRELTALACRHPALRFVAVSTRSRAAGAAVPSGHFRRDHVERVARRFAEGEIFVCGPPALQAAVAQLAREHGVEQRMHVERFVGPVRVAARGGSTHRIAFVRSGRVVDGDASSSLLEQAERAGLRPLHGCRMGICRSCVCKKLYGAVRNEMTGASSTEPEEEIQLCVTTPQSDVTLDL